MKTIILTLIICITFWRSKAQNIFPVTGDASINSTVPVGHGGGYNALWFPNNAAVMPENAFNYSGIYLSVNMIRNSPSSWSSANSSLPTWALSLSNGSANEGFQIFRSASSPFSPQTLFKISNTGNVGIGTTTPLNGMHIFGNSFNSGSLRLGFSGTSDAVMSFGWDGISQDAFKISKFTHNTATNQIDFLTILSNSGNVGIGTTTPSSKLTLAGGGNPNPNTGSEIDYAGQSLTFRGENTGGSYNLGNIKLVQPTNYYVDAADMVFQTAPGGGSITEKLRITGNGNVLVGKTSQANNSYKLDVNGNVRSNSIVVNTTGADFVFEPTYKLPSLEEVKSYIDKNHHLSKIPSAKEMQTNGLNVGENEIMLLQKVEELTLYLIEKDKKINDLQTQNDTEKARLDKIQSRLDNLEKLLKEQKHQ